MTLAGVGLGLLAGCTEKKVVGAPCTEDSECAAGTCAGPAAGFPNGYCTGTCDASDRRATGLDDQPVECLFVRGQPRWIAGCRFGYSSRTPIEGYTCATGPYGEEYLVPSCGATEDCRDCACAEGQICSPGDGWKCKNPPGVGEPCVLGRDECQAGASPDLSCSLDDTGKSVCTDPESVTSCSMTEDCGYRRVCTVETSTQTVCDTLWPGLHLNDVCYDIVVPPLLRGQCQTRLGTECETNEDCTIGSCRSDGGNGTRHCTSLCGDAQDCIDEFDEPRATCCLTDLNYVCMYSTDSFYCEWW